MNINKKMKIQETHFDHYIQLHNENSLHANLATTYKKFPERLANLKNLFISTQNHYFQIQKTDNYLKTIIQRKVFQEEIQDMRWI